jgi:hypothetical protein
MLLDMKKKYQNHEKMVSQNDNRCKWHPPTSDAPIVVKPSRGKHHTARFAKGNSCLMV